jgi:outer membrane protein assembly factor BamB
MLKAATAGGWRGDPTLAHELDRASATPAEFVGPLPFQASWYGVRTRQAWGALHSFPFAAGDRFFVVGPEHVIALKPNGRVEWTGPVSAAQGGGPAPVAAIGAMRGSPFSPAILCDASGAPQLLVVRQPESHGGGWALRALRAEDGHLLWTTEGQDAYQGLVFGSNPAVEGRYVYAIAGEMSDQLDHLWLVALEVTTGRQLWRCDIGTQSRTINLRPRNLPAQAFRPWMNQSAPAVASDQVIAAPNVGAVIAVGRFDGKLRWTRGYPSLPDPTLTLQRQRDFAIAHPTSIPPLVPGLSLRWSNTPAVTGETVVAAPEDSDQVVGLSVLDGKPLWSSSDLPEATLVGIAGQTAVFAADKISGIDVLSGKPTWTYSDQPVQGPAVLRGDTVWVPTGPDLTALSAGDGSAASGTDKVPDLMKAIATESAREALVANDLGHCFGPAMNRRAQR